MVEGYATSHSWTDAEEACATLVDDGAVLLEGATLGLGDAATMRSGLSSAKSRVFAYLKPINLSRAWYSSHSPSQLP